MPSAGVLPRCLGISAEVTQLVLTTAQKLAIAVGLLALLAGLFLLSTTHTPQGSDSVELLIHGPGANETIVVHVVGQVRNPGLYTIPAGARVGQAVRAAGGFTAQADRAAVNLARVLDDGEQITIGSLPESPQQLQKPAAQSPQPSTPSQVSTVSPDTVPVSTQPLTQTQPGQPAVHVSLNQASLEQLQQIPGIGPELAARILYQRHQRGGFSRVEDLLEIKGIGPATLEQIRPYVTL